VSSEIRTEGPEKVVQIRRCACVVKGGRRFSFTALVVVGDQKGRVGYGYGKGAEVPQAVDKAVRRSKKNEIRCSLRGGTIPHRVVGKYGTTRVLLLPAAPGTGVIAGASVRAVLDAAGVHDVLTKCRGSTNPMTGVRATMDALKQLRSRDEVARLRGVEI